MGSRVLDPTIYHVAWIAPLYIEAHAALSILDERHQGHFPMSRGGDYIFKAGVIFGHNVVIATFGAGQEYGTNSAAALASQLKQTFENLRFCLVVGIAAGCPSASRDIRLGDVLVALSDGDSPAVVDYQLGKSTADAGFQLLRRGSVLAPIDRQIANAIASFKLEGDESMKTFLQNYDLIKDKTHMEGNFGDPGQEKDQLYESGPDGMSQVIFRGLRGEKQRTRVWYGPIGSGNTLLKNSHERDRLRDEYNLIGLEMEAAGVMNIISSGVIRGVCDYGNEQKNKIWQPYAAAMAAAYAKTILGELPPHQRLASWFSVDQPLPRAQKMEQNIARTETTCTEALNFPGLNTRFNTIDYPAPNTTVWISQHPVYQAWINQQPIGDDTGILWLKGKPGAGKSTIMKSLVTSSETDHLVASFFFNGRGGQLQKTSTGMYRSLIYQLATKDAGIRDNADSLLGTELASNENSHETESLLGAFLCNIFIYSTAPKMTLFIDGLDECESILDSQTARSVASTIHIAHSRANGSGYKLNICISCRSSFQYGSVGCRYEIVVDKNNARDLEEYIDMRLGNLGERGSQDFLHLKQEIAYKASGIFLWAKLVLDRLLDDYDSGRSLTDMKKHLDQTPPGLGSIFRKMLTTPPIPPEEQELTLKFFQWAIFGIGPLRLRQWRVIMGLIRTGSFKSLAEWTRHREYPRNELHLENQIRRISRGLVQVSAGDPHGLSADGDISAKAGPGSFWSDLGESRVVEVIHESVRDLFLEDGFSLLDHHINSSTLAAIKGHSTIIHGCISYTNIVELDALVAARDTGKGRNAKRDRRANPTSNQKRASEPEYVRSFQSAASDSSDGSVHEFPQKSHSTMSAARKPNNLRNDVSLANEHWSSQVSRSPGYSFEKDRVLVNLHLIGPSVQTDSAFRYQHLLWFIKEQRCQQTGSFPTENHGTEKQTAPESVASSAALGSTVSQVLGNGAPVDVTAFMDYATSTVFKHANSEVLLETQGYSIAKTISDAWNRIVLLHDDWNKDITFDSFCSEARLHCLFALCTRTSSIDEGDAAICHIILENGPDSQTRAMVLTQVRLLARHKARWTPQECRYMQGLFAEMKRSAFIRWCKMLTDLVASGSIQREEMRLCSSSSDPPLLVIACDFRQVESIITLIQVGADPEENYKVRTSLEGTIIYLCNQIGSHESELLRLIRTLDPRGFDWKSRRICALSILCTQALLCPTAIRDLLILGADPNQQDWAYRTPLQRLYLIHPESFTIAYREYHGTPRSQANPGEGDIMPRDLSSVRDVFTHLLNHGAILQELQYYESEVYAKWMGSTG